MTHRTLPEGKAQKGAFRIGCSIMKAGFKICAGV